MIARLAIAALLLAAQAGLLVLALFYPDPPAAYRSRYLNDAPHVQPADSAS